MRDAVAVMLIVVPVATLLTVVMALLVAALFEGGSDRWAALALIAGASLLGGLIFLAGPSRGER